MLCPLKSHTFIAGRAVVMGSVKIGEQCFIGASSTIFNNVSVGNKCIIGGATIIKRDVPDYTLCKLPNDLIIQDAYDCDSIEYKLIPPQMKGK